jgi:uncharacterized protein YjiS (DUF1127 family)
MSCQEQTIPVQVLSSSLLVRAAAATKSLWHAYWRRKARRATLMLLRSLDDRALHDIGIDRSEIESVVHHRSGDRLRRYEYTWE